MELTDAQRGYIAGFLDGEGTIHIHCNSDGTNLGPVVNMSNSNLEVLETIQGWVGGRLSTHQLNKRSGKLTSKGEPYKLAHRLTFASKKDILTFLLIVWQYLIVKYDQAELMIDYCFSETVQEKRDIALRMKELNKR